MSASSSFFPKITWARRVIPRTANGYEVSSKGDRRFSALFAIMPDGRSLECWYQCDIKGYDVGGTNWQLGKGKPPLNYNIDLWVAYLRLWEMWASRNLPLLRELWQLVITHDCVLTDCFASTPINQAHALSVILNDLVEHHGNPPWLAA